MILMEYVRAQYINNVRCVGLMLYIKNFMHNNNYCYFLGKNFIIPITNPNIQ